MSDVIANVCVLCVLKPGMWGPIRCVTDHACTISSYIHLHGSARGSQNTLILLFLLAKIFCWLTDFQKFMGHAEVFYWTWSGVLVQCMSLQTLCCGCSWILSLHIVLPIGNFLTDILAWILCNMFCHLYCMSCYFAEPCTYCCLQVTQGTKLVLYLQVTGSMRRTGMLSITGCQYFRVAG
jgi:hypothetical protein